MLSVKQGGIKYHFLIGIERQSPGPLASTLPTNRLMSDFENHFFTSKTTAHSLHEICFSNIKSYRVSTPNLAVGLLQIFPAYYLR